MGVTCSRVVKFIRKGVGVLHVDVEYASHTNNTTAPTSGWQTTAPAWENGKYIWSRTHVVYDDYTDSYSDPVCLPSGKGVASIVEQYYQSTSATALSGGSWQNSPPSWIDGRYIWTRSVITYTDNTTTTTDPVNSTGQRGQKGEDGNDGNDGRSIVSITEYYLATSAGSGVTRSTSGWTSSVQTITSTKKYLWNYERIAYSTGNDEYTDPHIIGVYGDKGEDGTNGTNGTNGTDGRGIVSITEYYLATSAGSGVTRSTSGWTTAVQAVTSTKKYLWNYEKIVYTSGSDSYSDPHIIGVYGDKGENGTNGTNGDDGKGITSITEYYLATSASSGVTRSTSGWTTTVQTVTATKKYLWNYTKTSYTYGSDTYTDPCIIGVYGDKGDKGDTGNTGSRGPTLRGPQAWSDLPTYYSFQAGAEGESWVDVVLYNGNYYVCKKAHSKSSSNYPGSTADQNYGYWQLGDSIQLVATKILLATYALVKNLGVEAIDMRDANNNIIFTAKDGAVTCKTGTFENITVTSGTIGGFEIGSDYIGAGGVAGYWARMAKGIMSVGYGSSNYVYLNAYSYSDGVLIGAGHTNAVKAEGGMFAGLRPKTRRITTSTVTLTTDDFNVILGGSNGTTVTLPSSSSALTYAQGQTFFLYNENAKTLTINPNGSTVKHKGDSYTESFNVFSSRGLVVLTYYGSGWICTSHNED